MDARDLKIATITLVSDSLIIMVRFGESSLENGSLKCSIRTWMRIATLPAIYRAQNLGQKAENLKKVSVEKYPV